MAGSGWDETGVDASITVSPDKQAVTRGSGSGTKSVRGLEGRSKGRRYFEITPSGATDSALVTVGFANAGAALDGNLGEGSPVSAGWRPGQGAFIYNYTSGSGVRPDQEDVSSGVMGVLIDFSAKTCSIYRDGAIDWIENMDIADELILFPAVGLYQNTGAELQTVEPFLYPPEVTYIAWDKSDSALRSTVSGVMAINGAAVVRIIKAFSYDRLTFDLSNDTITESKPLGQTVSKEDGSYDIILRNGYSKTVFLVAFDDYGDDFVSGINVSVGDRIHPGVPNGLVYECTGAGAMPESEPAWSTDTEVSQSVGTASMLAVPFYRPEAHGPIMPNIAAVSVAKYWRIYIVANNGNPTYVALAEIEMRSTPGGADLCNGGTIFASSYLDGASAPANAFDNNSATIWATAGGQATPSYIGYVFAGEESVNEVAITGRPSAYANQLPRTFYVERSFDNEEWERVAYIPNSSSWGNTETRVFVLDDYPL